MLAADLNLQWLLYTLYDMCHLFVCLQRYVESGQPHILNKTRAVVALHKDRHMFPLSLCVARLSGVGTDTLFIGVMRNEQLAGTADNQIVKVGNWRMHHRTNEVPSLPPGFVVPAVRT